MTTVTAATIEIPVTIAGAGPANKSLTTLDRNLDKIDKSSSKAEKSASKLSGAWKLGAGIIATVGVTAVASMGKELINLASDAEETRNKFNVVFKDVGAGARASAAELAEAYGLSSVKAQQLLSDTGDLLTGFGFAGESALSLSSEVQKLAVDLASFTNFAGGAEGASQALTKALLGERESAKALGIAIQETDVQNRLAERGQDKLTGSALRQAKALVTLQIAQEQSKNAIGDFARSQDSFANVTRTVNALLSDLATDLGKDLLPIVTDVAIVFRDFLKTLKEVKREGAVIEREQIVGIQDASSAIQLFDQRLEDARRSLEALREAGNLTAVAQQEKLIAGLIEQQNKAIDKQAEAQALLNFASEQNITDEAELNRLKSLGVAEYQAQAEAQARIAAEQQRQAAAEKKRKEALEAYKKALEEAPKILAGAGVIEQQIAVQQKAFDEQIATVKRAGLETAALEQFQAKQRASLLQNYLQTAANQENQSLAERQASLDAAYVKTLEATQNNVDQRLAIERAYAEQSQLIEQARMQQIAMGVEQFAGLANQTIGIFQSLSQIAQNRAQAEIQAAEEAADAEIAALEASGATREEIEARRAELDAAIEAKRKRAARKAAEDQKRFQTFSVIVDTAAAVTKALASAPPPYSFVLAGLTAAAGAAQIAAIQSQPIPQAQFGGDFVVPPGNGRDSGLLRVNEGERVSVQPVSESAPTPKTIVVQIGREEFRAYLREEVDSLINSGDIQARRKGFVKTAS